MARSEAAKLKPGTLLVGNSSWAGSGTALVLGKVRRHGHTFYELLVNYPALQGVVQVFRAKDILETHEVLNEAG